ncbi:hypothetical protein AQUCO_02200188v1 [Aquilegia coerulea]|uniref:Uncharacterized protein n=1 Tax=Aquilegia coerulea TaxID=218851 RepID=A0A2G5DDL2_AQUCA|nr:hypothetical protein AQUCO_02200188v1 [Aquilegia coerulea]
MASTLSDNLSSFPSNHLEFESMEMSEIDGDLMMALLEESNVEEAAEDERLGNVIRSLEAEIDRQESVGMPEDSHDCFGYSASNICDSFDWIDMEMASTSYDDVGKWYAYSSVDNNETVDQMIEYGNNSNFALSQTFAGMEDFSQLYHADEHMYSSLWQETYDPVPVMYQ